MSKQLIEAAKRLLTAVESEMSPEWDCSGYHPSLVPAVFAMRAALSRPAEGDGWVMVPVEPTEAMLQAAVDAICYGPEGGFTRIAGPSKCWAAMLKAAPPHPTAGSGHSPYIKAIHNESNGLERLELSDLGRLMLTTDIDVLPPPTAGGGEKG